MIFYIIFRSFLEKEKNYVVFEIENSGPKIPNERLDNLFNIFISSGKVKGTGLGLASVKIALDFILERMEQSRYVRYMLHSNYYDINAPCSSIIDEISKCRRPLKNADLLLFLCITESRYC